MWSIPSTGLSSRARITTERPLIGSICWAIVTCANCNWLPVAAWLPPRLPPWLPPWLPASASTDGRLDAMSLSRCSSNLLVASHCFSLDAMSLGRCSSVGFGDLPLSLSSRPAAIFVLLPAVGIFALQVLASLCRRSHGHLMAISWLSHGHLMATSWPFHAHGYLMAISWPFHAHSYLMAFSMSFW